MASSKATAINGNPSPNDAPYANKEKSSIAASCFQLIPSGEENNSPGAPVSSYFSLSSFTKRYICWISIPIHVWYTVYRNIDGVVPNGSIFRHQHSTTKVKELLPNECGSTTPICTLNLIHLRDKSYDYVQVLHSNELHLLMCKCWSNRKQQKFFHRKRHLRLENSEVLYFLQTFEQILSLCCLYWYRGTLYAINSNEFMYLV